MTFSADMQRFTVKLDRTTRAVYVAMAGAVQDSIKNGSPITGAPGQPVDTGFLRKSFVLEIGPTAATISTNVAYAPVIEYNDRSKFNEAGAVNKYGVENGLIGPALPSGLGRPSIKSQVGGSHSVSLTIAGADRLLAAVTREVTR